MFAVVVALSGCSISTIPGPVWESKSLVGKKTDQHCIASAKAEIAGSNPWMEQQARQIWLEELGLRQRNCEPRNNVGVRLSGIAVSVAQDAYGEPTNGDPETPPPVARMRVRTSSVVHLVNCAIAEEQTETLSSSGWLPYEQDSFLMEERVAALVHELIRRDARQLDSILWRSGCEQ